jgi:hypothetical protein
MLDRLGWLNHTREIAGAIRALGTLTIFAASAGALLSARRSREPLPFD